MQDMIEEYETIIAKYKGLIESGEIDSDEYETLIDALLNPENIIHSLEETHDKLKIENFIKTMRQVAA